MLKNELDTVNQMLNEKGQEMTEKSINEFCITASSIPKSSRPGTMTMSQMMMEVSRLKDELADTTEELSKHKGYLMQIQKQVEEKAPLLIKQKEEFENVIQQNEHLVRRCDELVNIVQQARDDLDNCRRSEGGLKRENDRLKKERVDLSRQVCHLLREVENARIGVTSSISNDSDYHNSEDVISKSLVTFSDIASLQDKNQKLLAVVRKLSAKQEEAEKLDPFAISDLNSKLENMREAHNELLEQQERSVKMINLLTEQRDFYKNLYSQSFKGLGQEEPVVENPPNNQPPSKEEPDDESKEKIKQLETELDNATRQIKQLKDEAELFKTVKAANDKMLVDQNEKMRDDLQTLSNLNAKLTAKCESNDDLFKVLKNNCEVYKKQIEKLEQVNKIYSETIIKHETSINYLKDQTLEAHTKHTKAEVRVNNLEKENLLLRDSENRLLKERESLKNEMLSHSILHTNIELIKATLERQDAEGRINIESQLKDAHREQAATRRRLQEEQDRFRQLSVHLEQKTATAEARMEEERNQAEKLRKEMAELREQLVEKSEQIEDLTKKLKTSMLADNGSPDSKKLREIQKLFEESHAENQALQQKLKTAKETAEQHFNVAEAAEQQLKIVLEEYKKYREDIESKLEEKSKLVEELQTKCSELHAELSVQTDGQEEVALGMRSQIKTLETHNKSNVDQLHSLSKELEEAKHLIKEMGHNVELAEEKYSREIMLHSADIAALTAVKEELGKVQLEISQIRHERDSALLRLQEEKAGLETRAKLLENDRVEVETRFKNVEKQNSLLLDQLQALNTQLSVMQAQSAQELNTSIGDTSLNRSLADDEKSSEQLLKIIKYLRQEKEIAVSKCEILDAEHVRLKAQQELISKQLEEAKAALNSERQKSEVSIITAAKHAEVLRKVETLNAITDSNRSLRLERDSLLTQINELRVRTNSLEEQLAPLQETNRELTLKAEAMQSENVTLRSDAAKWRQRANILIEKSNRTSPEDWKKLQNERENLAKQLTIERGNTAKLSDELNTVKQEKYRLEEQLKSIREQQISQKQELDKLTEELGSLRTQVRKVYTFFKF